MKDSKDILRRCIACRQPFSRIIMFRWVHDRLTGKIYSRFPGEKDAIASGRSAYLCQSKNCIHMALKGKKIQKALKTSIPDAIVKCLVDVLKGFDTRGRTQS